MNRLVSFVIAGIIAMMLISSTMFEVDQRHIAIVSSFGSIDEKNKEFEPGVHFKLPAPFEKVFYLDRRIQTLDTPDSVSFMTAEKKNIVVDAFVKWKIVNPRLFFTRFGGDEGNASNRLTLIAKDALNNEITRRTVHEVISGERGKLMDAIRARLVSEAEQFGIQIVDVRLRRVDFVDQIKNSVYERMKAERVKVANEARSTGSADKEKISADAERQRDVILADAFREAQAVKGDGDAKASQIYAQAFGKNPEFYKFYRSLEAYRATFHAHSDVMVLDPNSEFFKYFRNPGTGK